ncbi:MULTISPECIES: hypothetical protein [unclassified Neptuniibacter]|nr:MULTISPECIES: hypothetical protein [unclassified Neptuniibacter]|tara:strand:- start:1085 stop:1228 length:144 start_codon:yes stop_codon:yes gene_type:complete
MLREKKEILKEIKSQAKHTFPADLWAQLVSSIFKEKCEASSISKGDK